MAIRVRGVGHVVLKVRNLETASRFYGGVLGLKEVARFRGRMAFFSAGENHHDLAVLEVGPDAPVPDRMATGLYHVALKIGDSLDELRAAKAQLEAAGVKILAVSDHKVSQSIYLNDPDGNGIELFVDADAAIWRERPEAVATVEPLEL
jgi:catechol 2,3-dioxygenase